MAASDESILKLKKMERQRRVLEEIVVRHRGREEGGLVILDDSDEEASGPSNPVRKRPRAGVEQIRRRSGRTTFVNDGGKNAQWMWLNALTVLGHKFIWGSATLAYLYRQFNDACRRSSKDDGIDGCMLLFSVECQPHGVAHRFGDAHTFRLNPVCLQDEHLSLMRCPLICN
ncbi:hypothetical protein D1007_19225 [Hordeum vulgare]|nr:hypothetical protein D1007_19225 [Hordeum vulgare]